MMRTKDALRVAVIALAGVAGLDVLGQAVASADEVEEFYGTGFRSPNTVVTSTEILSDCGDNNPSTNVVLFTIMGNVTYTGIIQGTGTVLSKELLNNCAPGLSGHASYRVRDTFQSVSVAGKTGGAVVELIVVQHSPAPGVIFNDNTIRILCGTGELKGLQAEGTLTATAVTGGVSVRPLQLWGHYGPRDDTFDFLCRDLPNHESDD